MKDHEIRELVNHVRDIAIKYHDHQSLRERIAQVIVPALQNADKWIPLLNYGQIKSGDTIRFTTYGEPVITEVEAVLYSGTNKEEVIYDIIKNHYFIVSMYLLDHSHAKNVEILK